MTAADRGGGIKAAPSDHRGGCGGVVVSVLTGGCWGTVTPVGGGWWMVGMPLRQRYLA
jgi:hypothetical protein